MVGKIAAWVKGARRRAVVAAPDAADEPPETGADGDAATAEPEAAPAEPEPEPEPATEEDATDGVFNLTAIHERKELPAPRRLDMNANEGEGEKPLRKQRLEKQKPRPRPFSALRSCAHTARSAASRSSAAAAASTRRSESRRK